MTDIQKPANGNKYRCFGLSWSFEDAIAAFRKRYGREPKECFRYKLLVWVGPVNQL
jgi:hypothetical protein